MRREVDIPPIWLALALLSAWGSSLIWAEPGLGWLAVAVIVVGVALMLSGVVSMVLARTTFVPRRDPSALVTSGLFSVTRNPIYLGDALILLGAILYWGAWMALPLMPVFLVLITRRYILDEERRLRAAFSPEFDAWAARVPRWIWRI
jgi:protein-S-isoprenylcysteine O-methyltransferase Ste14